MRLFFSVGEPSGDQHAAHLIHALKLRVPLLQCEGYGGPEMRQAGCRLHFQLTDLAVMGITQVLPLLGKFRRLALHAEELLARRRPDAVILVDFPGFNWWIARAAKKHGIPVYYYCPPQLWAWASWRVKKMRRLVDHALTGLEFEAAWLRERGVSAECVGHPFFDEVHDRILDAEFLKEQRQDGRRIVGILPGSRNQEVRGNWPIQLEVIRRLHAAHPELKFLVACFKPHQRDFCQTLLAAQSELPVELCLGRTSEVIELAEACLMVSGSVSLELLARRTPAVVQYYCSPTFYWAARLLVRCRYMSLPNLMVDRLLFPEFPIHGNPQRAIGAMTDILQHWLEDPAARTAKRQALVDLAETVAHPGGTERTADAILARLSQRTSAQRVA